ncbi:MAG: carboxypeptidase regulatory-like domain-containing protein [Vicinamibacterales bacterium]
MQACLSAALAVFLVAAPAFGQATSSISGTVVDSAGGAIPGATVIVTNAAGAAFETVSNSEGVFSVPALGAGKYTVTVSLTGFKTAAINVEVAPGTPASVKAVLEVGQVTETVTVMSSSELINTQTATVSSTLNADQLNRMPTPTRNALNAVTFLPGVNVATTNREARINGLPESFIQITLDGVSNNDNFLRSTDSFFASVTPRQDAIEAVTVTTAVQGAQTGGSGVVTINFQTRSGTNRYTGSGYTVLRDPALNTNYWFNERNGLEKNEVKLYTHGARFGGPISIPGVFDGRGKAFFFAHYEQIRFPNSFTRTRDVLHPRAMEGWFRYTAGADGSEIREVNVLQLAASRGQISTVDPTIAYILNSMTAAMAQTGTNNATSDPLRNDYVWLSPSRLFEHQPTIRLDYNVTDNHRLSGSYQIIWATRDRDYLNSADARFVGAPNSRVFKSRRPLTSIALRSTLSPNVVNEFRVGITAKGGQSIFGTPESVGPHTFADTGGFAIDLDPSNDGLTNWHTSNTPSWRSSPTYSIDNSVTWQRGGHSLSFGGGALIANVSDSGQTIVPQVNIGFSTALDPAAGLFTSANFPGASTGELTEARELYALLTGRVSSISSQIALDPTTNKYVEFGPRTRQGNINVFSLFAQDSWRVSPTVTLTGGLRWDVQTPFSPSNDIMSTVTMESLCGKSGLGPGGTFGRCNFNNPNATGGVTPEFIQLTKGTLGYKTDWNNLGPTVGVAWRPNVQDGFLRALLGDPDQATFRAGYSVGYERHGTSEWTGTFGSNPGATVNLARSGMGTAPNALVPEGGSWPVLLSQTNRLVTAPFSADPVFPIQIQAQRGSDLNGYAPDIKIGSAQTWTASFQRSITRDMAMEVRYVGTYGRDQWSELNYNSIRGENLLNNGFLDEFRAAMANLQANNASGISSRSGSFAYFGPGTGTNPLPTYLAYFNGRSDATNPAAYTGGSSTWASSTFASRLVAASPSPITSANDLDGNSTRRANAIRAGLSPTFFVPNPDVDDVNVTDSGAFSDYHALQVELRRRLSKGLSANVNYQYAIEGGSAFDGFSFGRTMIPTANVRHAIKTQWDWTLPVGRGQRFGADMPALLDAVLGGWSFMGVGRVQARVINFGNVRLVGMTVDELTKMYKFDIRLDPATGLQTVYMLPADVILNTRRAFSFDPTTPTGYSELGAPVGKYIAPANSADCIQVVAGDCAPRTMLVRAPWFTRFDIGVQKRFPIRGAVNFEVRLDVLNVFDNINFNPVANPGSGATIFQTGSAYTDPSNTYDPGGRIGQLVFRLNW